MADGAKWFSVEISEEPNHEKAFWAIIFLGFWTSLYSIAGVIKPTFSPEGRCRSITFLHGSIITILAYYSQFFEGPEVYGIAPGLPNNITHNTILKICLGYFIFDLTWCVYYQTEEPVMIVHHVLSLFALLMSLFNNRWGCELVATLGGTELTNPLLQARYFMRILGKHKTSVGEIIDLSFMFLFGYLRLYLGGFIIYSYLMNPRPDFWGRLGGVLIYILSWVFMLYIVRYAIKKYSKMLFGTIEPKPYQNGTVQNGIVTHPHTD